MLDIKILNSGAQLNDFRELSAIEYVPGEDLTLVVRMFDSQLDLRRIPATGATYAFVFQLNDGTELTVAASELDVEDRSILTADLTAAQTETIIGSSFRVEVTEGASVIKGVAQNVLQRVILTGSC